MDVEHLSYSIRRKTEKIFKLKDELDKSTKWITPSISLTGLCTCYIVLFSQRYTDYTVAIFNQGSKISSNFFSIDIGIILFLIGSCFLMYKSFSRYSKAKSSYEAFRKDLIKSIDTEFCNCSGSQDCKDEYLEEMEKYGINLMF
jgi:hypothetical protein